MRVSQKIILWGAVLLALIVYNIAFVSVDKDMSVFLPPSSLDDVGVEFALQQARQGSTHSVAVIKITGNTPLNISKASKLLTHHLSRHTDVGFAMNGTQSLTSQELDILETYRYLLSPVVDEELFSLARLKNELMSRLDELMTSLPGQDKSRIANDPVMALRAYLSNIHSNKQPLLQHGVWFTENKQSALVVFYLNQTKDQDTIIEDLMNDLRKQISDVEEFANIQLQFSGHAFYALQSRKIIETEIRTFTLTAIAILVLVLLMFYRSPLWVILAGIPLLFAYLTGSALTNYIFDGIHGITLAFGAILLGITIDYPVHYFSHARQTKDANKQINKVWRTLLAGAVTSSVGFSVMWLSDYEGLQQLGCFTISGLLIAALCTRYLLPVFPLSGNMYSPRKDILLLPYKTLYQSRWIILALVVSLMVFVGINLNKIISTSSLLQFSPIPQSVFEKDKSIRKNLGIDDNNYFIIITGSSSEVVLQRTENLSRGLKMAGFLGNTAALQMASQLLPSQARQLQRRESLPERQLLQARLEHALMGTPFNQSVFQAFINDVDKSRSLAPLDFEAYNDYIGEGLLRLKLASLLRKNKAVWYSIIPVLQEQMSPRLEKWIKLQKDTHVQIVDLGSSLRYLLQHYNRDIINKSIYGTITILVLLAFLLRSVRRLLAVTVPLIVALTTTIGILLILGEQLGLFHLISLMLVVGIGLDYGLFMTRSEPAQDKLDTWHALLVCVVSTTAVFMVISFSDIYVLHAVGLTVAVGVLSSFIMNVIISYDPTRDYA